ncbi:hypothetical protein PLESTB_001019200 [Pleodorina starrii]|uniref:Uncharacterized protein n=1 Tax=Pleodorina starrii TaxID=330485 RepID=A0A9W6F4U8_9CHLO|nr:hypothetical protein PLESTB_001019200 [Pleodorina starrii]
MPFPSCRTILPCTVLYCREDEEEFDAITEMIVPKRMHLVSPASPVSASSAARPQQPPSPSPSSSFSTSTSIGGVGWGPASDATLGAMLGAAGGKLASGFSSSKLKSEAEAVWVRLRQDGPPFFRKVRTRAALDVLEDESAAADAVSRAAEELWGELCGQTWRVELDYGLEGSEAEPRDELLLAVSWLAAARLLNHAGIAPAEDAAETAAARRAGAFVVHVSGYDASSSASASLSAAEVERDGEAGGSGAPRSWRDLRPRLQPLPAPTAAAAEAAAAAAV